MRSIAAGTGKSLRITNDQRTRLKDFLVTDHKKAEDGRFGWTNTLRMAIRSAAGNPVDEPDQRWRPFAGAPRVDINIDSEMVDTILSQVQDLLFQLSPPLLVRSRKPEFDKNAIAMQRLVDYGTESGAWNFESGTIRGCLDIIQGGTGIGYIPYTKTVRVTDVREVVTIGPRISIVAPENIILPAGADKDIQQAKFITMVIPDMSKQEAKLRARLNNWTIDDAAGTDTNMVSKDRKSARGLGGGTNASNKLRVGQTWCFFDLDGTGIESDLKVTWNMTSGGIWKVAYNEYNWRPFVLENYQDQGHTWAGMGVPEMVLDYKRAISEIWNNHIWNMMIANTKIYTGPSEALSNMMEGLAGIYPGLGLPNDSGQKVEALNMGEINSSAVQAVTLLVAMAKERVGVSNLTAPIRSSSRTPGISMLSMLQQANRRFTHPFNNMRNFAGQIAMQCLYRIQEEVRGKNRALMNKLEEILGEDDAELVIDLMRKSSVELSDALDVECKVASVSVNRESDRQNFIMLATQVIPLYWQIKKELAQYIAQPPFKGADKAAKSADEVFDKIFDRVVSTFDQISDPRNLHISLADIETATAADQMLQQLRGGDPGQGGPQGAPPPPQMPMAA